MEIEYKPFMKEYQNCRLCPRRCQVNRLAGKPGFCRMTADCYAARAALHMWEEPCLSGQEGSGTVFFSGCTLRCVFCQNREISQQQNGQKIDAERLADIFLSLQSKKANNINLVTPTHFVPHIRQALIEAKGRGLRIPVVYNTGGYETVETIRSLAGLVDIYLPDFKYMDENLARNFSAAPDYAAQAKAALQEMIAQTRTAEYDERGMMRRGVIVRHLVLPGHRDDSMRVIEYLHRTYGNTVVLSILNQYTPMQKSEQYRELNRALTTFEYEKVLEFAGAIGVENGFRQTGRTDSRSFIPPFEGEGL